jgi:hypothetical protein
MLQEEWIESPNYGKEADCADSPTSLYSDVVSDILQSSGAMYGVVPNGSPTRISSTNLLSSTTGTTETIISVEHDGS